VGGGLAGSEAAYQLAERGYRVVLHEMRPLKATPAHKTDRFAELVCSNTFKSTETTNAHGLLKAEMRLLGSMVLQCADDARVPGGSALAVDRDVFSRAVQARIEAHGNITIERGEVTAVQGPCIIASGPLTSDALAESIRARLGVESLSFYDAIAPIVSVESIDQSLTFRASRYDKETMPQAANVPDAQSASAEHGSYINCPMSRDEYEAFIDALLSAEQFVTHDFDQVPYFEGCMPIEEMARRGRETLRFGPMKPVGLKDPRTGKRPHAVVQLRQEDKAAQMWNLVGFQTRMRYPEQARVCRMIPGLASADFHRFGSIHRNAYLNAPGALTPHLSLRDDPRVMFAGQLTGVEGYTESTATGLVAALNMTRMLDGLEPVVPPSTTMLGALYRYLREADPAHFQPMNANFGLVDALPQEIKDKRVKRERIAERALADMDAWRLSALGSRLSEVEH
jgi:methylenetetrahydrofolate--tRNA-(uracil-5-)-methyltransferase